MPLTKKRIIEIAESYGWSVYVFSPEKLCPACKEYEVEFRQCSPAGEDFSFSVYAENLDLVPSKVKEYKDDFDVNEHVKLWAESAGRNGTPEIDELVEDAKEIKSMLIQLTLGFLNNQTYSKFSDVSLGNMRLGELLTKHFGCKNPVLKKPRVEYEDSDGSKLMNGLTVSGQKAYSKLTALLYDLEELLPDNFDANNIIEILDNMVKGECEGLRWE